MKKVIIIVLAVFLIISSFGAIANNEPNSNKIKLMTNSTSMSFSELTVKEKNVEYVEISLEGISTYLMAPGKPMLPKVVKTIELPFGVKNVNVKVTAENIQEQQIFLEVKPAPVHLPLNRLSKTKPTQVKDLTLYENNDPYPTEWYSYAVRSGLNKDNKRVTYVMIDFYPVKYYPADNKILTAQSADVHLTYEDTGKNFFPTVTEYDLVIIAPDKFLDELGRLKDHKDNMEVKTLLTSVESIYDDYTEGTDKPEQIKLFIKDAIETYNITYVLLFGGLKSWIWAKGRDDRNQGSKWWHVPVRYDNLYDDPEHPLSSEKVNDPGVITDLYYADIYENGGNFSTWDPNKDGIFAAFGMPDELNIDNDEGIDMMPDVSVGRLACRNLREVKDVIDKIIKYEEKPADPSWFKRVISVSGDGFLDQEDLDFQWDTTSLPDGEYTIKGQSHIIDEKAGRIAGPIDEVTVTIDRTKATSLSFRQDDNENPELLKGYPAPPITDISSVSDGDILGITNMNFTPKEGEAYCNEFTGWAEVNFTDGVLHIRGKSYDPREYGNLTDVHIWIVNSKNQVVYSDWRNNTEMYYEGEWVVGDKTLLGGGGASYYMDGFEKEFLWASNGNFTGQQSVIDSLSKGAGFAFLSGHGSPNSWGDHYPGIPGDRRNGSFTGLRVTSLKLYPKYFSFPLFPMNKLENHDKLPIVLIGGCHNSQFNVSMLNGLLDIRNEKNSWKHLSFVHECFSWYLVKLKGRGAIATLGNTGLGYGILGKECLVGGLDGGICIMFFEQYSKLADENNNAILGEVYTETLREYITRFITPLPSSDAKEYDDHVKSLHQWVLLGDPTLMIGGYPEA